MLTEPPPRRRRLAAAAAALAAAVMLATSCADDSGRGAVFTSRTKPIEVEAGDRFSIAVPDNASFGDNWKVLRPGPKSPIVRSVEADYKADDDSDPTAVGGGGTLYFVFEAEAPGRTEIVLRNCFRGVCDKEAAHRDDKQYVVTDTYRVTVR
ncbi:protease inhibitor I42 family protein [Streptomyces sp. NPDC059637]|uniref:protease inhibitor I42 family protein n=1 Tax=Streptomyces sp. NPDC059637 TaxID=3347752 RepID=UPI0036B8C1BC